MPGFVVVHTPDGYTGCGIIYWASGIREADCRKERHLPAIYIELYVSTTSCPLRLDGEIYEIDCFLPQAHRRGVVIYPCNLVPICHPCNHITQGLLPLDAHHSLLHPYIDRLQAGQWLLAQIDQKAGGPILNFWVHLAEVGEEGLKSHFISKAAKNYELHGNTIEAAAYRAASVNAEFCAVEFKN